MKVSIVIPNWNGKDKLAKNLPAVLKVKGVNEIIVSDDASSDKSIDFIKTNFPQVTLVQRSKNGGFSSNVNTGVKASSSEFFLLLNTDAKPDPDCVQVALKHFDDPQVFSVGCSAGGNWVWAKFQNGYFWHNQSIIKSNQAHETLWASGGSAVFKRQIWDQLEGLDQLFDPFYEEDLDIGYRALKRGFINIFEPKAHVEHYKQKGVIEENFTKKQVNLIASRNQLIFIWKNLTSIKLTGQHLYALAKMLVLHPGYSRIFLSALLKLPQILRKRRQEVLAAKLTDEEILAKFRV